jgi:hypothetical protein
MKSLTISTFVRGALPAIAATVALASRDVQLDDLAPHFTPRWP